MAMHTNINPLVGDATIAGEFPEYEERSTDSGSVHEEHRQSRHSAFDVQCATFDKTQPVPDMWSKEYIGLYCQYASIGLMYGSTGALIPFCAYVYDGPSNVCANSRNIVTFAWNLKIFYAILVDSYRPFGMRRKPWMLAGWAMVLVLFLVLAFTAHNMSLYSWLIMLLFTQAFAMLSDVPADGYCVELGQLESPEHRGQILATGQRVRFFFCVIAGVIQTFLLNGPTTNADGCPTSFDNCWSWGLTINQYYGLLFALIFILSVPIVWLKELDATHIPQHTVRHFFHEIWLTLQNLTTFYLVVFVIGVMTLTNFTNNANVELQYYVIQLTNFQSGIDTITTYGSLVIAIWLFQRYMIDRNWRHTQLASVFLAAALGLVWIAPYYNAGGTMDPWFTIFIDLDTVGLTCTRLMMPVLTYVSCSCAYVDLRAGSGAGAVLDGRDRAGQARPGGDHLRAAGDRGQLRSAGEWHRGHAAAERVQGPGLRERRRGLWQQHDQHQLAPGLRRLARARALPRLHIGAVHGQRGGGDSLRGLSAEV
jgi:hypothetical protein